MPRDGEKSITVAEEQVEELDDYGDSRKDQMATVLMLASQAEEGEVTVVDSDDETERILNELRELRETMENTPNMDDIRNATERGVESAMTNATR